MKISVDNQVVRLFSVDADKVLACSFRPDTISSLSFCWPSLLEYLELGELFSNFTIFDETSPLFIATISALKEVENPEDLFYIYDSLFTEMLKQVKALPEVDAPFLLQKIHEKKGKLSFLELEKVLSPAIAAKEKALQENAPYAMHDLVLYLAWDRMCVCMGRIFDYQSSDARFLYNLKALKWCLIESYQHIVNQGRTFPSFYRLMEALFYYQMREEHLQQHTEDEWELLSQSFQVQKNPNKLVDVFYIDQAIVPTSYKEEKPGYHLTLDSPEIVEQRLALADYMISRLKEEMPQWHFTLQSSNIIFLPD